MRNSTSLSAILELALFTYRLVLEKEVDVFEACYDLLGLVGGEDSTLKVQNRLFTAQMTEHKDRAGQSAYSSAAHRPYTTIAHSQTTHDPA